MAVTFSDLHTEAGLKSLEAFLSGKTYISGDKITKDDVKVYAAVLDKPSADLYPTASQWYDSVASKIASSFPGNAAGVSISAQAPSTEAAPVKEAAKRGRRARQGDNQPREGWADFPIQVDPQQEQQLPPHAAGPAAQDQPTLSALMEMMQGMRMDQQRYYETSQQQRESDMREIRYRSDRQEYTGDWMVHNAERFFQHYPSQSPFIHTDHFPPPQYGPDVDYPAARYDRELAESLLPRVDDEMDDDDDDMEG